MWYLKTKVGLFWIVEADAEQQQYYLGCDEEPLGCYTALEDALTDMVNQETGYLKWDEALHIKPPPNIEQWEQGSPENWEPH